MAERRRKCRRCGGLIVKGSDGAKCALCGQEWMSNTERHQFYVSHKDEILKDVTDIGRQATLKKWQICGSTMVALLKRWAKPDKVPAAAAHAPESNHHLPGLPAFSDKWPPEVIIKWLEVYQAIATQRKREEETNAKERSAQR